VLTNLRGFTNEGSPPGVMNKLQELSQQSNNLLSIGLPDATTTQLNLFGDISDLANNAITTVQNNTSFLLNPLLTFP
jgi:hypothetical protein